MIVSVANTSAIALAVIANVTPIQAAAIARIAAMIRSRGVGRTSNNEFSAVTTVSMPL